jgi:hypothetical protein
MISADEVIDYNSDVFGEDAANLGERFERGSHRCAAASSLRRAKPTCVEACRRLNKTDC